MTELAQQKISFTEIQALWLTLKEYYNGDCKTLDKAFRKALKNADDSYICRLKEVGLILSFFQQDINAYNVTKEGFGFSKAPHCRLWQPPFYLKTIIETQEISHFFIDNTKLKNRPVVIDLFAGVGGLSLGFAAAGFDVALAVENDPHACEAHKLNFPDTVVLQEDIVKFAENTSEIIEGIDTLKGRKISGIIGGPPCQGFSLIGERSSTDERNLLTSKFIDVVLKIQPDFFVMENVPGLIMSGAVPDFQVYLNRLGSTSGDAASRIISKLPELSEGYNKPKRQFKKKLISLSLKNARQAAQNYFEGGLLSASDALSNINFLSNKLKDIINDNIGDKFDGNLTNKFFDEAEEDVNLLSMALTLQQILKVKILSSKSALNDIRVICENLSKDTWIKRAIEKLIEDFESQPSGKIYKGLRMGPILLNLIERAEEFYDITPPQILNAASFGTPQDRERIFLVGFRKSLNKKFEYPKPTYCLNHNSCSDNCSLPHSPTVRDAIEDLPDIDKLAYLIDEHEFSSSLIQSSVSQFSSKLRMDTIDFDDLSLPRISWDPSIIDCSNRTLHDDDVKNRMSQLGQGKEDKISKKKKLHPERLSPTLRAGTKSNKGSHTAVRPIHYIYPRVISVREGGRLMGYPDWMTFHKTKWHGFRLVGNGVPYPLSNAVAKQIKNLCYSNEPSDSRLQFTGII